MPSEPRTFIIAAYITGLALLSGCGPPVDPDAPSTIAVTQEVLEQGEGVYRINCVACHGPEGKGDGPSAATLDPKPRDHSNREYMDKLTDQEIADTIVQGGAPRGYPNMPSNPHIKGDDLASLVAFVRTLGRGPDGVSEVVLKTD